MATPTRIDAAPASAPSSRASYAPAVWLIAYFFAFIPSAKLIERIGYQKAIVIGLPELLVGPPPQHVEGSSRIRRGDALLWERPFLSGEANMSHSLANLEAHHFKYAQFRRPGDVHVHFFGTATLSFTDGVRTEPGDVFEIEAAPFMLPLRNPLSREANMPVLVRAL